ncbi:saccharopine dehydrogenase NADP-binding domain-containing protein [Phytoactinopolyspora halotolerans]|uniref:NAD(P)H-binding protein n=1 Tax=Phytoactinopolyspora halotolerans TaxID=1981512 RepID=A0A6L9SDX4_9ACTN|nr:saccharopine dehydrogenase NADP-binding domain-containing protein [Phytoactinopolyspora halotolerans]NEE02712.1 NAD(P)H-binding protein [Phytoactinopolyspora halotolerans]
MIAVAGASGSVGRWAVGELTRMGIGPVRLGGRRVDALRQIADETPEAQPFPFDLDDPESVARFCDGCTAVLNCAGPSYLILDTLARAAIAAGAAYVDVSGDEPVHRRLTSADCAGTVVLSAGMLPGLSSLIPRWMATEMDKVDSLSTYIGGLERCSPSSATDMILSMHTDDGDDYGHALAGWRNGRLAEKVLRPQKDVEVPFFPDRVSAHPFFSGESARLATAIGADTMDFWNVFVGDRLVTTFTRMRSRPVAGEEMDRAVAELTRAAELDLFGREPYYALVFRMTGVVGGRSVVRTAALRTGDAYRLIATVGALAVQAVVEGGVGRGVGYAADVLDPGQVVAEVRHSPAVTAFELVDHAETHEGMEDGTV